MDDLPLQQHSTYTDALRKIGLTVTRHIDGGSGLSAAIQHRPFGPLRLALISRGPCWTDGPHPSRLSALPHWAPPGSTLVVNADSGAEAEWLKDAGYLRLMTPSSVAELPLSPVPEHQRARLLGKWRNRLARAEDQGLTVQTAGLSSAAGVDFLQAVTRQSKARRYRSYPAAFFLALAEAAPKLLRLTLALSKGQVVAGVLTAQAGQRTTYFAGHTTALGRMTHAHNLLLWTAIARACKRGHRTFDLGLADDEAAPGLTHFKRGTGATIRPLGGTWLARPRLFARAA